MGPWDKLKITAGAVSAVVIPVVLLLIGNNYSAAIKERELQGRFVELAVAILREAPTEETRSLRTWATDVINRYSGVELPEQARRELIESLQLSAGVVIPRTQATRGSTDFSVFICEVAFEDANAQQLAGRVIAALGGANGVGEVDLKPWGGRLYDEIALSALRGKLTVVADRGHPEYDELPRVRSLLSKPGLPPLQVVDNRGAETAWRISLILCP